MDLVVAGAKIISSINNMYDINGLSVLRKGLHSLFCSIPCWSLYLPESLQIALVCDSE